MSKNKNVYQKLNEARVKLQGIKLRKSGKNKFAGYEYFELGDFLPTIQEIFGEVGLCGVVSFDELTAKLTIINCENPDEQIVITSPLGSATLKGCHEVQNIGAVETYQRRYLWVTALEIVEHDILDSVKPLDKAADITVVSLLTDEQCAKIQYLCEESGVSVDTICNGFKVGSLEEIPSSKYAAICKRLEDRKKNA